MDKNIIKIIGLVVGLVVLVVIILLVLIKGVELGPIKAISIASISERGEAVEKAKADFETAETTYNANIQNLERAKKEFDTQKEAYELISDEKIAAVKEATKEEEYLIEYLWITLGNYATAHNLELAVIEPGGNSAGGSADTSATNDITNVSTGTGVSGDASGVTSTPNAAATGSPTSGTQGGAGQTTSAADGLSADASALSVQVKGTYMDLADFVFEVENDKSLRFRLDNIKMTSAGGVDVTTSFKVKDFTVLKYLQ